MTAHCRDGPSSAVHRFTLHRIRDTEIRGTFTKIFIKFSSILSKNRAAFPRTVLVLSARVWFKGGGIRRHSASKTRVNALRGMRDRLMFFLLRMTFWLAVVCVLVSIGKSSSPEARIDASQAVTLASAAVSDVRGFCERQPDACETGGKVAVALGHKAEAGARTIFDFISKMREKSASNDKPADKAGKPVDATGTLNATDMAPAWRAPVPLP